MTEKQRWYREVYLWSDHWRATRLRKLSSVNRRCEGCKSAEGLQVHHPSYKNIWREPDSDLKVLCDTCHGMTHHISDSGEFDEYLAPQPLPQFEGGIILTREMLHDSINIGAVTRAQAKLLNVSWPPKKGWLSALVGTTFPKDVFEKVRQLKGIKSNNKQVIAKILGG